MLLKKYTSHILYLVVVLVVALLDLWVVKVNFWVLYGIPIALATWNLGKRPGFLFALVSIGSIAVNVSLDHPNTELMVLAFRLFSKMIAFCAVVALVAALRKKDVERAYVR